MYWFCNADGQFVNSVVYYCFKNCLFFISRVSSVKFFAEAYSGLSQNIQDGQLRERLLLFKASNLSQFTYGKGSVYRSSRSQMLFTIIGILKNFTNFTRKYLCWSPFLIKKLQT